MLAVSAAQAAAVITSLTDFNAAIGTAATATFDNDIPGAVSITFGTGTTSTLSGGNLTFASTDNTVVGGRFEGLARFNGSGGAVLLTWDFGAPVIGFGADFGSGTSIGGTNNALEFSVDGGTTFFDLTAQLGGDSGFRGYVDSAAPFQTVLFRDSDTVDDQVFRAVFNADNLVTASASDIEVIPLPAGLPLLLAGLGAVALLRRRSTG